MCKLRNNCSSLPRKQEISSDHTGNHPIEDRNGNCRWTGGILTRQGDKRSNHEFQNTDAQGTRAPTTTLYVLCGLQEKPSILSPMISSGWLAGQTVQETARSCQRSGNTIRPSMDFKVDYKLEGEWSRTSLRWWHHPVGHFGGRTRPTGVGGSPRPSQPRIQSTDSTHQRQQDQGDGERRHSVPHTHSEWTAGAGGCVPVPWVSDYKRWWVYDGISYQVKQRTGITAKNMEKSQH